MIEHWMRICDVNGYVKPTYYQGQYNLYHRHIETTLFPVLRKYNMRFTAFRLVVVFFTHSPSLPYLI